MCFSPPCQPICTQSDLRTAPSGALDVHTARRPSACITLCHAPSGPMRSSDNHGHHHRTAPESVEGGCHMSRWTATRLAQHTTALLRDARLILVSNRAPYNHRWHSPAPLVPGADTPLTPGTALLDGGWLHRLSAQPSRVLRGDHTLRWSQPAGGLTTALDPVMQACHGTWVAGGSGSADRQPVDAQ